jgi:hypothetical protein
MRMMTIDKTNINDTAVRIIDEIVTDFMDSNITEYDDKYSAVTIGYIKGVCDMANAMKEVLKN